MSGAKAFGEESPTQGETAVSWQTWSDGNGGIPGVEGDADWGKLRLNLAGAEGRSAVYDLGSLAARTFTLTENAYGTGNDDAVLQIRTATTAFSPDDATPAWITYTTPLSVSCRYVQIRETTVLTISILGDSISVQDEVIDRWPDHIQTDFLNGSCVIINHSVSGAWITTQAAGSDMDEQTVASADDDADIIFILLGTNGDTYTITDEYQENLEELQTSNPGATIYGIGIMPRADPTDNGRSIKNPRIATACANAGVTYWDTDGWIDPATDTTDGLHPTAAGQIKIANEILARL